ncbi:MAG: hypothetical protein P8X70_01400 [Nanoarchaeota archaeon]
MTKKKKEKFNIFNEYKKSLDYIKESKEFIFAIHQNPVRLGPEPKYENFSILS